MAKYKSSGVSTPLPKRTLDYLQTGAPEGKRNAELFDATCQFRDAGQSLENVEEQLLSRAMADGLTESEARTTIQSAFAQTAREPLGGKPQGHAARPSSRRVTGPPEPIDGGFRQLLDACFQPDEHVAIAIAAENEDGEIKPRRGTTLTAAEWKAKIEAKGGIEKVFSTKLGLFVRINPMIKGGAANADVTAFRHVLVEFDCDQAGVPIPKEEQYRAIMASGMPISALIDSGNKSLHAWVRVDAPNEEEYKRCVAVIWKWFAGQNLDKQNSNPSRLSRCPDGRRTVEGDVRRQSLLATRLGAASWAAWESGHSGADLPPFVDLKEFIENGCQPELPTVADVGIGTGMLYAGRINEIHGEPGTGKSNVAIAMSNAVMEAGGTVLYIDPEDVPAGFTRRALQFGASPENLIHRCKYLHNPTADDLASAQRWAAIHRPVLVVLDGMAESMAAEGLIEDKAGDVINYLRDRMRPFAERAGAAVLISDHVAKSSEDRGLWARGSGAKMGRYDGAVYNISLIEAYSPGHSGSVKLTLAKDRNGGVGLKGTDVAEVHFTPAGGQTVVSFRRPQARVVSDRPTTIIRRIENFLTEQDEADKRTLRTLGKAQTIDKAIEIMEAEGTLLRRVEGNRHIFTLKPGRTYKLGSGKSEDAERVPCS